MKSYSFLCLILSPLLVASTALGLSDSGGSSENNLSSMPSTCILQLARCMSDAKGTLQVCLNQDPIEPRPDCKRIAEQRSEFCANGYAESVRDCRNKYEQCLAGRRSDPPARTTSSDVMLDILSSIEQELTKGMSDTAEEAIDPLLECLEKASDELIACNIECIDPDTTRACFSNKQCPAKCASKYLDALKACQDAHPPAKALQGLQFDASGVES